MNSIRLRSLAVLSFLLMPCLCARAATDLPFGQVTDGSIASAGQTNSYTFTGNSGDVIDFTVYPTSGSLSPSLKLTSPSGSTVASVNPGGCATNSPVEMNSVTLSTTGTYTLLVGDCSDVNTGTYEIYSQRINNPGTPLTALTFGQVQSATITTAAQSNTFQFSGNAGDVIDFTAFPTQGGVSPRLRLYNPNASLNISANPVGCATNSPVEMNSVTLPTTGTYTLLVGDCSDVNIGTYEIYSQRINNPGTPLTALTFGQVQSATITTAAQSNTFQFSGNAGDVIDFTAFPTQGGVSPRLRLYNPNASLNISANPVGCATNSPVEMNSVTLPTTGTYTLLVGDCSDVNIGTYEIYSQRINNPGTPLTALTFGQVQSATITTAAQSNTFQFSGNAGDVIDFTAFPTQGGVSPRLRLYNPNASLNISANPVGCATNSPVEMNSVTLPTTGTYTLLVGDCSDVNIGTYEIYSQRINNPGTPLTALTFGQVQSATITTAAQSNTFQFSGNAGDVIDFTAFPTQGGVSPRLRLYNPNASLNISANPVGCATNSPVEMNSVTLPTTGTYTLLVGDCSDVNIGTYEIYSQRINNPGTPLTALTFGQVQSATITTAAQSNTFQFSGNAGDVIDFTAFPTQGGVSPRLRLYNPNASLNISANPVGCATNSPVEMNSVTLPTTGTYTLLVGDCSDVNIGTYEIYSQRINNPGTPLTALTFGQVQSATITTAAQSNTFQFSGNAGDVIDFTAFPTQGGVSPRLRLYNPNASLNISANPVGCATNSPVEMNSVTLPTTGTYTLLVGDCSDTNTGTYSIYAQRLNNPGNPISILWGKSQTSTIGSSAYSDTYTFNGASGDSISITAAKTSGSLNPKIRLYNPDDSLNTSVCGSTSASLSSASLAQTGTYTMLIGDCGDSNTGNYTLTTQCSRANSSGKCTDPLFLPNTKFFHGTETLSWAPPSGGTVSASANLTLSGPIAQPLGSGLGATSSFSWNTTTVPDGNYQLTLTFLDANGNTVTTATKNVLVNNSVVWHEGTITSNQTWTNSAVQGIDANLIIPSGVTVTIEPGTIVKVVPGVGITVQSGGILNALGTSGESIVFTSIYDAANGGDTMMDGGTDDPSSGEWDGVTAQGTGQFNTNSYTELLYWQAVETGTLAASETWSGSQLFQVTGNITVPSGATLTIQPGAVVKFNLSTGITVEPGGSLIANGTVAQPIYFTSINDNSVGGNTNSNSGTTPPASGDWGSILINGATATFNHVQMSYGGGPVSSTSNLIGMIQTTGAATVTVSNSILAQSFWDGILAGYPSGGGVVTLTDSVLDGLEGRAINVWPGATAHIVNDTFDNDGVGILLHGGTMDVANCIVANSKGISGWGSVWLGSGGTLTSLSYTDVWSTVPGAENYGGSADLTGSNGNISANPVFVNEAQGNYRLNYGSPAIDAADGMVANYSLTDIMGDPRYNDPEVTNKTGIPDTNGNYPDMGAYEFVQNAASNIDFTVTSVTGPAAAMDGDQVQVTWTDTSIGSGTAIGPWHDSVYLVQDPDTNPVELFAAQVLVGTGVVMGPGASVTNTATIRVPGSTVGNQRWEVKTNTAGDIFEGQNTANNTGLSLSTVYIDLPQLVVNGSSLSNSFASTGQSSWYKLIPGADNTISADLNLTGSSGSVQLFVGQGYVPTPQQFDIQQQQFNSPSVSAAIPNTTSQTYYVTAYAQTLPSTPAAFSISAASQSFSLTSVQPSSIVNSGNDTVEFIGAELSPNATYQIVASNGAAYTAASVDASDSAHVYATFAATGLATGAYSAQVTENGSTATLKNAITVTASSAQPVTSGQIAYDLEIPDAVRAGYGGVITINYTNTGSDDVAAPLMVLTTTGATTTFPVAVADIELSPNYATQYTSIVGQGQLLGINQTGGPVGILPAGASGSVSLNFAAGSGSDVQFSLYTVTDPTATIDWASAMSSMQPSYVSAGAWSAIFANFTANVGSTWGTYNAALANDATYLGQLGTQEYRVSQLQSFELMKAGLDTISRRYYLGAFGYGASHPFDISAVTAGGGYLIYYPNGAVRAFIPNPSTPGQFIGGIGDYATLAYNSTDESVLLTEKSGIVYHFVRDPSNSLRVILDYIQDLNGNRLTASYTNDLVTTVTSSTGDTLTFTYDANGRITQSTDPVGRTTTYSYDSADQHLLSITNSAGTTSMTYVTGQGAAQQNALQSVTWPDSTQTSYGYDAQGRLTSIQKDGGAQPISLTYATTGAVTIKDALGNAWQLSPDESGSLAQLLDPLGNLTQNFYNPEENLIRTIAPDGSTTLLTYDSNGNPTGQTDPLGNQLSTLNAANGNLLSLTDPLGNATQYGYDSHYNATTITYPDTRQLHATYDSRGNILTWTNRRGQTINYTWNGNNLLTQKAHSSGASSNYTYDAHRNLQSVSDSTGTTNFSYDSADRIQQVNYPNNTFVKYTYNSGGQRASLSDQTGYTVNYGYDSVGRLSQLTSASGALIASYTYDSDGRLSQKNLGNGAYSTYAYDAAGNVLDLINYSSSGIINSRFDYTYDASGRKVTMTTLSGQWQYTYDADGQLTLAAPPSSSNVQYTYDAAGNRITTVTGGTTTNYNVNNLNQYTSVGGYSYSYDADGNLISKQTSAGTWAYTYDDEGHQLTASGPNGSWKYQYNSLGERISSVNGSTTTQYLVDPTGIGNVEGEFSGTGTIMSHFANGLGLESSVPASGSADFYQFDDSGNTATMTGAGGAVQEAYSFLPFGEKLNTSGTAANPFAYVGQYGVADDGNGLYYIRARYYDPSIGRFISQDPIGLRGGTNLYNYADNSPTNLVDPSGECFGPLGWLAPFCARAIPPILWCLQNEDCTTTAQGWVQNWIDKITGQDTPGPLSTCGSILNCLTVNSPTVWNWLTPSPDGPTGNPLEQPNFPTSCMGSQTQPSDCTVPSLPSANPTTTQNSPIVRSADPNGKITTGYGNQGYIPPNATITYTIYFENQSSATAPAAYVSIVDVLDPNLDPSTVQLSQVSFNNVTLNIPGALQSYTTQANVSTSPDPVTVNASLNPSTGTLTWTMQSIDPTTGEAPADPLAGFLPPDNSSLQGEGFVIFTVKPKSGLTNGTAIQNTASIVFDANGAIKTNTVTNTIDSVYPSSAVAALPATETTTTFTVSWNGSDPSGSGIASYDVFTATDGGAYSLWLPATTNTSANFSGSYGHSYSFYTMATDNVGNRQQTPGPAQTTQVVGATQAITFANPGAQTIGTLLTLSATASSGLTVSFASTTTSVCTVSGTTATFIAAGSCTIDATQAGNGTYAAATMVSQSFTVNAALLTAQTITFANPGTQAVGTPLTLSATASSGLTVSFASTTTSVCTVSGTTATFIAAGSCTINATQAGNSTYAPATMLPQSFTVNAAPLTAQTITFANSGSQTVGTPLTLSATATSGLAVTFTSTTTSVCTVSGTPAVATFVTAGACTIDANQAGNSTYAAATMVAQTFTVNLPATPTFTITGTTVSVAPGVTNGNNSTITVTPSGGFTGPVNLSCAITPEAASDPATCSIPASVTISGAAQTSTLTVYTTAATTCSAMADPGSFGGKRPGAPWYMAGGSTLACLLLFGIPARRRRWRTMLGMVAFLVILAGGFLSCGGSSSPSPPSCNPNTGTTAGTYTITVTGTSGTITTTGTVTLTVQ